MNTLLPKTPHSNYGCEFLYLWLEFQIRLVVVVSVTLLPDFRVEHRIGVLEKDCSLQEPQRARHLCRHFACSTAGVLQLPERPV